MRPMTMMKVLVVGASLAGFAFGWAVQTGGVVAEAQEADAPVIMKRIYTGTDGLSHVEHIELNEQSVFEEVTGMSLRVSPPGRFVDYHVAPGRRYIINLTGGGQLEVAEGKVDLPAGSIEYIDDLTGKGHTTANVGDAPRVSIHLEFADQNQIIGPIGSRSAAGPAADQPVGDEYEAPSVPLSALAAQPASYQRESIDITLEPGEGMEYKYRLEPGGAVLFSWTANAPVHYELHSQPDGAPRGFAESYDTQDDRSEAHGSFAAPFAGIHGWYWENRTEDEVTIRLATAGFYSESLEYRSGADVVRKAFP